MIFDTGTHIRMAAVIHCSYEGDCKQWSKGRRSAVHFLLRREAEDRKRVAGFVREMRRSDRSEAA